MSNRLFRMAPMAVVTWILLGGVSQSETIPHGAPRNSIPQATQRICPGVPDGVAFIPGLETGWAIEQPSYALRLVFSDQVLGCRNLDAMTVSHDPNDCQSSWRFALTLAPELQQPGIHELRDQQQVDFTYAITVRDEPHGCSPNASCMGTGGGQAGGAKGPDATIEIYNVTDQCITGRIHRLETGLTEPKLDLTGAFHAVRCAAPE